MKSAGPEDREPLSSIERKLFEGHMAEIFSRFGMDLKSESYVPGRSSGAALMSRATSSCRSS